MQVSEALRTRITCRAFLEKPVEKSTLLAILEGARWTPSGGNLQPWNLHAIAGARLKAFLALIAEKQRTMPTGEGTEYAIFPKDLTEPYKTRRFKCGEDMFASIGVAREDKLGRRAQFDRNFRFFEAPAGLFFTLDRRMEPGQWADLGMFVQSVMLLAREYGLHTAPQEAWANWPKTIADFLQIPEHMMLFCGMSLGYMDEAAPINQLRTERAPVTEWASLQGFD